MPFIIISIIAIIVIISIRKKKKREAEENKRLHEEREKERINKEAPDMFYKYINDYLDRVKTAEYDDIFHAYYNDFFNSFQKEAKIPYSLEQMDQAIRAIPTLKVRFTAVFNEIVKVSENNTCFHYSDTEQRHLIVNIIEIEQKGYSSIIDLISQDIIKTLPVLADYFEIYHELIDNIYRGCLDHIISFNDMIWGILEDTEETYSGCLDYSEMHSDCTQRMMTVYNHFVDVFWDDFVSSNPQYRGDIYEKQFKEIGCNKKSLIEKWTAIWHDHFREIGLPYSIAWLDLFHYFESIENENASYINSMSEYFVLFGDKLPYFLGESTLRLSGSQCTKEECFRILNLYKRGLMKGSYTATHEINIMDQINKGDTPHYYTV